MRWIALAAAALVVASPAWGMSLKPRASVTTGGRTQTYKGGKCIHVLNGFRLDIGKLTGPRFFTLQYVKGLGNGTHKGAVLGIHYGTKYLTSPNATITLKNGGKTGTFSGKWDHRSGGGSFRGSFSC